MENLIQTGRIDILKDKMLKAPRYASIEQARIITRVYQENEELSIPKKRALSLKTALEELEISVEKEELIVGNRTKGVRYGVVFPESGCSWINKEFETLPSRPQDKFLVREKDIQEFREEIYPYWNGKSMEDVIKNNYGKEINAIAKVVKINQKDHAQGHICPDSALWLKLGPKGLIKKAQKKLTECDESQKEFYECTILVLEGAVNFMVRYHDYIMKMIDEVEDEYKKSLELLKGQASVTTDGKHVELAGNIGTPNDVEGLIKNDAEGVGLYRTEFLYMDKEDSFPTEEEQYEAYKAVLEGMSGKPVVIRTLDIGGDKKLDYLQMDEEMNPFLGYRAIRLCLDRKEIFTTQLRALYRASVHGKLRIMFPMISSLEELLQAKAVCEEVKAELDTENIPYSKDVEVGMMIEVPSAAVISDVLAKHVDFFSIGTNDLIQYTCAVDRMNQKISYLYNQFNPAVLRLIKMVIENAHKEGKWAGMCGESAGDQRMIPILLGFGLDEFSMSPISILPARKLINSVSEADMKAFADKVLELGTAKEIEEFISETFK